jgi:hypothetical protein
MPLLCRRMSSRHMRGNLSKSMPNVHAAGGALGKEDGEMRRPLHRKGQQTDFGMVMTARHVHLSTCMHEYAVGMMVYREQQNRSLMPVCHHAAGGERLSWG